MTETQFYWSLGFATPLGFCTLGSFFRAFSSVFDWRLERLF